MTTRRDARRQALRLLYEADMRGLPPRAGMEAAGELDDYAQEIVCGVEDSSRGIDALIVAHAENWDLERMSPVDRGILRIATWEMRSADLPPAVAIDEAVELAKEFSAAEAGSFVNGVLAAIAAELREQPDARGGDDE